ncbi:MAG: hypothetical protein IPN71_06045 [Fibrobacteres bacterium]|jgi:hypothetical protein|nr:hypothetical protein [Fibrobacterota bacterium]
MIFGSVRGLALLLGSVGAALMAGGCNSSEPKVCVPPDTLVQERDTMPLVDSLGMRKAILGLWKADTIHTTRGVQHWPGGSVHQVLIEPYPDRKDPTVRRIERTLASWGHRRGPLRGPTSIMANIRVRFQGSDGMDLDTLVLEGDFYPQERSISGEALGSRSKGSMDLQLEGWDRLNVNSFRYRRVP